ncbi:hypothetical protein NQZ68_038592 [Dissostichus eleginoides]|nr:hypothetical protein NQZ68_038592 [Dissostichus eleginoides]
MLSLDYYLHSLLLVSILRGVSCEDLTALQKELFSPEGSTVTLSYRYSKTITASDDFFWYRQYPGKQPEFLLYISGTSFTRLAESVKSDTKFSSKLSAEKNIDLSISSAAVTDSAVYYSALRPTVTGNTTTLYKNLWSKDNTILHNIHQREPLSKELFSPEGSTVTLSYRYSKEAAGNDYFFWYRQYPGEPPEFLLSISGVNFTKKAESLKSDTRFFTDLSEGKKRVDLQISSAAVTDSAVYYCAVKPTVTGNTNTLYKNLWSKDNTILHNIHQRDCEDLTALQKELFSPEGSTVTLSYNYSKEATGGDCFFWYRQYPGKPPEFIFSHLGTGGTIKDPIPGLKFKVEKNKIKSNEIKVSLSSAAVTDSAVYYCAVKPTVTGNTNTLYKNLWSKDNTILHSIHQRDCEDLTALQKEGFSPEGSTVTLSYRYSKEAAGNDYFFWYRQYPGEPPEFLLSISGVNFTNKAESLKSDTRFFTDLSEGKKRVGLQISSAAVTDYAVYYCAVKPTVTGNTNTLYKNLWSKDNTILHNIHQRESITEFIFPSGVSCEDLTPVKTEEFSPEGSTVTLSYRYSKQAAGDDYFFWYRQYPGEPPEFLLSISGANFTKKAESLKSDTRFFTDLSEGKKRVDLQISSAAVTDCAVFYCAVKPTVTGNTNTLYTNLWSKDNTILHNILQRESLSDKHQ